MKKLIAFLWILSSVSTFAGTAPPKYPVSEIPETLLKDANAVMRENTRIFRIIARDRATLHVHFATTILNEQGKSFATEIVGYDKLTKVKDIKGVVYDADGQVIKRLKNTEIYDQSAYDGVTLFSDNRLKAIDLRHGSYPYTVEIEYELELKYLFYIPRFLLQSEERLSVQEASFTIEFPSALRPKYRLLGIEQKPVSGKTDNGESLKWTFSNITPYKVEPHGPGADAFRPQVLASPSEFEYADYVGSMNTWNEFGKWVISLNKGRDDLPESTRQQIIALTADMKTIEEKAKAVYQFLQSRTRYVGIQLGIGGYQPFEASVVDETGYGDCKALSNYMVSMLKAIGIKSHYALINAGPDAPALHVDFVSSQFNHAVVAVPNGADTLWLECTSQTNPFGYAGLFTGDRKALLITENGAKIANSPRYRAEDNIQACSANVTLDISGNAKANVKTIYKGLQYENSNLDAILANPYDQQKKWVLENTRIPSFDVIAFSMSNHKHKIPSATVELNLHLTRFANTSGKRIFLTPNLMNRNMYVPPPVDQRKSEVVRKLAFIDIDTIRYQLPEGMYPEFVPEDVRFKSSFGEYEASFEMSEGKLVYIRKLKMNKGVFAPTAYQELIDFYRNIGKADNTKMVLMTKT